MITSLKLTVLVEDTVNPNRSVLKAAHGLSIYAETVSDGNTYAFLADTGPSHDILLRNADALNVDLQKVGGIFISHGHLDHTGGLIGFLKHAKHRIPVIAHPMAFEPKFKLKPTLTDNGSSFMKPEINANGGLLLLSRTAVPLMEGVSTTGEVERVTSYENVEGFWTVIEQRFTEDMLIDDQSLLFSLEGKGLVIISGCAHSGIVNTVKHSTRIMKNKKVHAVIGGFHLGNASDEKIRLTVNDLASFNPEIVCPIHCTGKKAVSALESAIGDRCRIISTGDIIEL
jgi:7,8-dihydropterin-6-yl-methyl-4-(beta-D-ribofuranosyl)aminobenzene 5'-phosphate synthase